MCLLFVLMFSISAHIFELVSSNLIHIKCDFNLYLNGCEDSEGSVCDRTLNECICKLNHTIRLNNGVCLLPKTIDENCITSAQCLVKNSACFASDPELKQWKCQCNPEFWLNDNNNTNNTYSRQQTCDQRHSYGESCHNSNQCAEQLYCSTSDHKCVCDQDFHFDAILKKCYHKNSTKCDDNQEWSQHLKKCVQKVYYSNRGTSGGGSGARAGAGGRASGSKGWFQNGSGHRIKSNIYFYLTTLLVILMFNTRNR